MISPPILHGWTAARKKSLTRSHPPARSAKAFLLTATWAATVLGSSLATEGAKNVLVIIADDLNRMISPLGDPNAITPNLERLAARSVSFDNATCQYPYCAPSRTALFMGLYPWITGTQEGSWKFPNPHTIFPNRVGLPEYFRNNGYWTASYGKTEHLYQPRNWDVQTTDFRFAEWNPHYDPAKLLLTDKFNYAGMAGKSEVRVYDLPPEEFIDGVSTSAALRDLAAHRATPDSSPFFVVVGMDEPHAPWEVPQSIYDQYDPAGITLNDSARGRWPGWSLNKERLGRVVIPENRRRDLFRAYLSGVTLMDFQVGRLLDYLDEEHLWDDTIVVFFSDNGYSLCEHERLYSKRNISRENISVPLMIHDPDTGNAGSTCSRQVELQDLFPTLVESCGLPSYQPYLSGRSITPLLLDPAATWPHVAKATLATPRASYASAKIVQYGSLKIADGGGTNDLFLDHSTDPSELNAEWATTDSPPADPKWAPLLDCLQRDMEFAVGQAGVFYGWFSIYPPDRDSDGIPDSQDAALGMLGFRPWKDDDPLWKRLHAGFTVKPTPAPGPGLVITMRGFEVTRSPGFEHVTAPLQLMESEDLETWLPSGIPYVESADRSFHWLADEPSSSSPSPQKFYRLAVPRL